MIKETIKQNDIVITEKDLKQFRSENNPELIIEMIKQQNRVFINWKPGVGKNFCLDRVIMTAIKQGTHDFIVVAMPQHKIINESEIHHCEDCSNLSMVMEGRSQAHCGPYKKLWEIYDQNYLTLLGIRDICGDCKSNKDCKWYLGISKSIKGKKIVFITHAHLKANPLLLQQLLEDAHATNPLFIMDEIDLLTESFKKSITRKELESFKEKLVEYRKHRQSYVFQDLEDFVEQLMTLTDTNIGDFKMDLPVSYARDLVDFLEFRFNGKIADFVNLLPPLRQLMASASDDRWVTESGDIVFKLIPKLYNNTVIFSASGSPEFVQTRLGTRFYIPYTGIKFMHSKTKFYNLKSWIGSYGHFKGNKDQIAFFFCQLITQRIKEGKKIVLLVKNGLKEGYIKIMNKYFKLLNRADVKVYDAETGIDPYCNSQVPIIHFGAKGVNIYSDYDCLFCLSGFYTNDDIVEQLFNDNFVEQDIHIQLHLSDEGERYASTSFIEDHNDGNQAFLDGCLDVVEKQPFLQAVARVRPYTTEAEVFLMQNDTFDDIPFEAEFSNLEEARNYFGLLDRKQWEKKALAQLIWEREQQGARPCDIAKEFNMKQPQIHDYLNYYKNNCQSSSLLINKDHKVKNDSCKHEFLKIESVTALLRWIDKLDETERCLCFKFKYSFVKEFKNQRIRAVIRDISTIRPTELYLSVSPHYIETMPVLISDEALRNGLHNIFLLDRDFICFDSKYDIHCLLQLGIEPPKRLWDPLSAEMAMNLGEFNHHYFTLYKNGKLRDESEVKSAAKKEKEEFFQLNSTLKRYGLEELVETPECKLCEVQVLQKLYPLQKSKVADRGLDEFLEIEMEWNKTAVVIERTGLKLDVQQAVSFKEKCNLLLKRCRKILEEFKIENPFNFDQITTFIRMHKFSEHFQQGDELNIDKDHLEEMLDKHPVFKALFYYWSLHSLHTMQIFDDTFVGADGRIHPIIKSLDIDTGRLNSKNPCVHNFPSWARQLVISEPGRVIMEFDYSQQEVGLLASLFDIPLLKELFEKEDVYIEMIELFTPGTIKTEDQGLEVSELKDIYKEERDENKTVTLTIINDGGVVRLARQLGHDDIEKAKELKNKFYEKFPEYQPQRKAYLEKFHNDRFMKTIAGFKRFYGKSRDDVKFWEDRSAVNFLLQGAGSVILKDVCNHLKKELEELDAFIITTVHDSIVVSASLGNADAVKNLVEARMKAVYKNYTELKTDIGTTVRSEPPYCWSKGGNVNALQEKLDEIDEFLKSI